MIMLTNNLALRSFALALAMILVTNTGRAELVFSVTQLSPAGLIAPNTSQAGSFGIQIQSTIDNQQFSGADFTISLSNVDGAGGRWVGGTNELPPGASGGFFEGSFDSPGAISANFSSLAGNPINLGPAGSQLLLATIVLSTVDASPGDYFITLSELDAVDAGFNQITSTSAPPLSYTIAVPEPSAVTLAAFAVLGSCFLRRKNLS